MHLHPETKQRVKSRINEVIGADIENLKKISQAVEKYKEQVKEINQKLNYEENPNLASFMSAFQSEELYRKSIEFEQEKLEQFQKALVEKIMEIDITIQAVDTNLKKVKSLQQLLAYSKILRDVKEINNGLKSAIGGKDDAKMVNLYLTLYEDKDIENSVIGRLHNVNAPHLKYFAIHTAVHWHSLLKKKCTSDFQALLKTMRWGEKDQDPSEFIIFKEQIIKAQILAEYLFLIKSPEESEDDLETITPCIVCQPISTVTKLLLTPYRLRFMYHFFGQRQTNRLDKPEWFFTQILNWGKQVHLFVGQIFQHSAVRAGKINFNIRLEFLRGLVQLTIEKLNEDIEEICEDENLFAHLIDETLAFETELRENFGYPASFPSALSIITQPLYLPKWISLEERFCTDKMDVILQGEDPWKLIDPNVFEDELKIPKCADQFVRLLEAIKDRYCCLVQPGQQLQFLALQLDLIDDFRTRLVQMHSSGEVSAMPILNAINYLWMVLSEWGESVHYLHLHASLVGPNANKINSVFEEPTKELEHWMQELLKGVAIKAVNEIKAKSMSYRHNQWSKIPEQSLKEPFILSSTAGEMFQVLVTKLHNLECELSARLFNSVLRMIARKIDNFLYDSLVMTSKFSPAGAAQFNYDMTRNLFALFGQYTQRPDLMFKKVNDSCKLLTAARATALLLHESLQGESTVEEKMKALKELGVVNLKSQVCSEILEKRTDIRIS